MAAPDFHVIVASGGDPAVHAAQHLRYRVFVSEMGGAGAGVDHAAQLECDAFDPHCTHLLLLDRARGSDLKAQAVGAYRIMDRAGAEAAGQFYTQTEYDLSPLLAHGGRLLELGRSCVLAEYRGGAAMYHLWSALAEHVDRCGAEILFGVASFPGCDAQALAGPLSLLHHRHLAPPELRVSAKAPCVDMETIAEADLDRRESMLRVPALIKAYLRLGGFVGEGAYLDHTFNTTDVCLILEVARMDAKQRKIYQAGRV
jgi:putative hemolysin